MTSPMTRFVYYWKFMDKFISCIVISQWNQINSYNNFLSSGNVKRSRKLERSKILMKHSLLGIKTSMFSYWTNLNLLTDNKVHLLKHPVFAQMLSKISLWRFYARYKYAIVPKNVKVNSFNNILKMNYVYHFDEQMMYWPLCWEPPTFFNLIIYSDLKYASQSTWCVAGNFKL